MDVILLTNDQNEVDIIDRLYISARTCYSTLTSLELCKEAQTKSLQEKIELIKKVLNSGHTSIAEHISFTFLISDISRSCSHQLVRNRIASYSQASQRYINFSGRTFKYVTPPAIKNNDNLCKEYDLIMEQLKNFYDRAVQAGVKAEDARFVLPNAACTNVSMTMNLRELMHVTNLRCCSRAQWEIRAVFLKIRDILSSLYPWMKEYLDANCKQLGYCPEGSSCGAAPKLSELLEIFGKYKNSQNA